MMNKLLFLIILCISFIAPSTVSALTVSQKIEDVDTPPLYSYQPSDNIKLYHARVFVVDQNTRIPCAQVNQLYLKFTPTEKKFPFSLLGCKPDSTFEVQVYYESQNRKFSLKKVYRDQDANAQVSVVVNHTNNGISQNRKHPYETYYVDFLSGWRLI